MLALADPDLDNGPRTDKSATMRMCAVSRDVLPIDELIRFVVAPSGDVIPDLKRKLPGRGLWVQASRRTVAEAVRRHQFSRGFKRDVRAATTLPADTEGLLEQGRAGALIHASDGAADGIRKLDAIVRQRAENIGDSPGLPIVTALTSAQLDLALGRSNVIHAALLAGPASKTFLSRCQILVRYRMDDDDKTGDGGQK